MALENPNRIDAPPAGPNRRGLLSPGGAIRLEDIAGGDRWLNGYAYGEASCDALTPAPMVCDSLTKDTVDKPGIREFQAVLLFGSDQCTTLDNGRPRVELATANLLATESFQMEQEVWDGVATRAATPDLANTYLALGGAAGAEVLDEDPVPYRNALAVLDHSLSVCLHGGQGMIHAVPLTVDLWWASGLLQMDGQRLLTPMGNIVIAGSGYSGSAPGASAGDAPVAPADVTVAANAYGTGLVYVALGAAERIGTSAADEVDRSVNLWTTIVERPAAYTFSSCCVLTLEVDHQTESPAAG